MSDTNYAVFFALMAKRIKELQSAQKQLLRQQVNGTAEDGLKGEHGAPGPKGEQGAPGPKGDRGPMPKHQWKGTKVRFEKDGGWGPWVDLEGAPGAIVVGGASGVDLASLPAATDAQPEGFVVKQAGRWVVATPDQMREFVGNGLYAVTVDGEAVTVDGALVTVH